MKTKCENCGSGDFTRFIGMNLNFCNTCGAWWFDGGLVAVPECSQWNTFEKMPNHGQIISILRYNLGRPIITTRKFGQDELDSFKKFGYKWMPVFLPEKEKS